MFGKFTRFLRREDGNTSIEFVVMLPLFVVMLTGAVDLSKVYIDQSNAYSAARDTARLVARHALDEQAAEAYVLARMSQVSNAAATSNVTISGPTVTVQVTAPITALAKFDFLKEMIGTQMSAQVTHAIEPI